ncbi:MAG: AAA family ATPase [Nitrospirae bacterium]|nr:AAA family ATPase [Nitrospirota bacterium]MBF0535728.1 AAA family ATPase [Nitrospirota bacterium]MBF0617553.1 AAA family ATPase [Nitrospirota bacterium]
MHEIEIKEFGPLKDVTLPVKDLMLFIGPQASGKSTISKWIYLFKSFKDIVAKQLRKDVVSVEETRSNMARRFVSSVIKSFGPIILDAEDYLARYTYKSDMFIDFVHGAAGFSKNMVYSLNEIIRKREAIGKDFAEIDGRLKTELSSVEISSLREERQQYLNQLEKEVEELFDDHTIPIYIPAGRSFVTVAAEQILKISLDALDYLMSEHIGRITVNKSLFTNSPDKVVTFQESLTGEKAYRAEIDYVIKQMYKILKGEYRYTNSGERIYFEEGRKYIPLQYASSGQQETLWILNILFLIVLKKQKVFLVIEEPEAHLYPVAQKDLVELIAFVMNHTGSQVLITTHSPYILTAFNNLIYAGNIGKDKNKAAKVSEIIDKTLWVDINKTGVHFIDEGKTRDIISEKHNIIDAAEIDKVSDMLNERFDKLYDLDD